MAGRYALYIHIPFCRSRCAYCDFNTYAGQQVLHAPYLAALRREMARAAGREGVARTLYVGGGTPTVLPVEALAGLICTARARFALATEAEVTVEANPGTVDAAGLRRLRAAGANRLSLGIQSLDDRLLQLLGRIHSTEEARRAVRDARQAGFENLNLDLIFALPGQTLAGWQADLWRVLDLAPAHLSLYALTVEEGTPLAARIERGALPAPDDDLAAEMYLWAEQTLAGAGYVHYEISNWARPGAESRHNRVYWRNEPYLGLGAGAHSWAGGMRWSNHPLPGDYIAALAAGRPPAAGRERIGRALEMGETMMMGLRLLEEGVSLARFRRRFGVELDQVYSAEIADMVARDLLERTPDQVRLTREGHLLGNQVFAAFLP